MNTKLLRQKILDLAIRGKLTEQKTSDGTTKDLLKQIQDERTGEALQTRDTSTCHCEAQKRRGNLKQSKSATPKEIIPLDKSEAPFEIPENWEWVRLGDICKLITKGSSPSWQGVKYVECGILFVTSENVGTEELLLDKPKYLQESFNEMQGRSILKKGDLLTNIVGASIGRSALYDLDYENANINQAVALIRLSNLSMRRYVLKLLNSEFVIQQMLGNVVETARANVSLSSVAALQIPLPPLAEQQRIVEAIEKAFAEITEIENNQELLKKHIKQGRQKILDLAIRGKLTQQLKTDGTTKDLLKQIQDERTGEALQIRDSSTCHCEAQKRRGNLKQSKSAFSKEITPLDKTTAPFEIPDNWEWVKLGDIGDWQSGTTPSKSNSAYYENGTIPWLNTGDLNDGLVTNIPKMVTETALKETSLRINAADSVCIAMYGATIGKLGILSVPATTNQACCVCNNLKVGIEKMWLFYFLMNHKQEFIEAGFGGAQPNISKEKIVSTPIPLPPLAEQQRIVATIEQAFAEFEAITCL